MRNDPIPFGIIITTLTKRGELWCTLGGGKWRAMLLMQAAEETKSLLAAT
jgi:hypothetical protein